MKIINIEIIEEKIKHTIEVNKDLWKKIQENTFKTLAKKLKLAGFRAGHVPEDVAKKYIDQQEVIQNSVNKAINETYEQLIRDEKFNSHEVIEEVLNVEIKEINADTLKIAYLFEKYPNVTLPDYKKIKIGYQEIEISDLEINTEINRLTKKDTLLIPKDSEIVNHGDLVNFDFKGFIDEKPFEGGEAKGHELEIGSNMFIPGFEEQMIGLKKGQSHTIEVIFPKDYHTDSLAGKKTKFELLINDIKIVQRPKLDDAYIGRLSIPDVNNYDALKKFLKDRIFAHRTHTLRTEMLNKISKYLIDNVKLSHIPNTLLKEEEKRLDQDTINRASQHNMSKEKYLSTYLSLQNDEQYQKTLKENATNNLKLVLTIEKIIEELKLDVSDEEINDYLTSASKAQHLSIEEVKNRLHNNFEGIKTYLLHEKTFNDLIQLNKNN